MAYDQRTADLEQELELMRDERDEYRALLEQAEEKLVKLRRLRTRYVRALERIESHGSGYVANEARGALTDG